MTCPQCEGIEIVFDEESIEKELKFYRRDGADDTTLWLVEALREQGVEGSLLLDIGGGLGAIQHELLESGVSHATHVDGSSAYIEGAKEEAERRGIDEQIEWHHGNFVDIAPELDPVDIVTLDRVICCYDDMQGLVGSSVKLAERYYGIVLPRDLWWARIGFKVMNFVQGLMGNPFRAFVHPMEQVEKLIANAGFERVFARNSIFWQVAVYARN
jgi:magnesium-protoporphyrin O-methyltransferase